MGNLTKRLATAAVLVPAVLTSILVDPTHYSVAVFAAVVSVTALDEYLRMALPATEEEPAWPLRGIAAVLAAAIVLLPSLDSPARVLPPLLTFSGVIVGFATLGRSKHLQEAGRHFGVVLSGLLYVPVLMSVLPLLKRDGEGYWLIVVLCMAFFSDTVAYFFGRAWGKHKLYPAVSPKKTWEGSLGGVIGSVLATVVVGSMWLIPDLPISHAVPLGIVGSICGQAGDLVESMIKRTYGVKDSGRILPGHGGMLDRIDALVFVAPVAYYYVTLVAAA